MPVLEKSLTERVADHLRVRVLRPPLEEDFVLLLAFFRFLRGDVAGAQEHVGVAVIRVLLNEAPEHADGLARVVTHLAQVAVQHLHLVGGNLHVGRAIGMTRLLGRRLLARLSLCPGRRLTLLLAPLFLFRLGHSSLNLLAQRLGLAMQRALLGNRLQLRQRLIKLTLVKQVLRGLQRVSGILLSGRLCHERFGTFDFGLSRLLKQRQRLSVFALGHQRLAIAHRLKRGFIVNAEPLIVANMESEGLDFWQHPKNDTVRMGTAEEAADWVRYCNDPSNAERIKNGAAQPFGVKYWQIGNETSYRTVGFRNNERHYGFTADGCVETTKRFAAAMKAADPSISIIGWGDSKGAHDKDNWCRKMSGVDDIEMIAFHHHFNSGLECSPLTGTEYRDNYECTWVHLMNAYKSLDAHISMMRQSCGGKRLAMTEGHFALPGRNRNEVLSSWGAGVAYARCLNTIMRNSDVLDIATMADFFGNVWQVNALMLPTPIRAGKPYLQPVGAVMALFGKYQGKHALDISFKGNVDVVASATDNKIYLHLANIDMKRAQEIELDLGGAAVASAEMHYIAEDPATEITPVNTDVFAVKTVTVTGNRITLPPAAVAAVEITLA